MRRLHKTFFQVGFKAVQQAGFVKLQTIAAALLVCALGLIVSGGSSFSTNVQAQSADCTPSLHRLLQNGQQLDIATSVLDDFVNNTPIGGEASSQRLDELVVSEGFASIPLKPDQASGERDPKLKSAGIVYQEGRQSALFTIWRIRNRSSQDKVVTLTAIARSGDDDDDDDDDE